MTATLLPYQYVVLRYVPQIERGERVNVGVILYCQKAAVLACSWHLDEHRLRALDPTVDVASLAGALRTVVEVCAGAEGGGRPSLGRDGARFGWLKAPRSTVLQPGPVHGGVCADPHEELARLSRRLVHPPPAARPGRRPLGGDFP